MERKVEIGENAMVDVVWHVLSTNYSDDAENNVKTLFAKKYGIPESHVKVSPCFISTNGTESVSLNSEMITNIHDPKFQQSLFPVCLAEHGIKDYDLDALIKIDGQMNALIDYDSYEKGRKYTIKWLDWSNFLSYGPVNHIDFQNLKGLVLLNSEPANQGGKSTFAYDLLHFLFFGRTTSGKAKTLENLFNNHLPEETKLKVEGCICIDNEDYIIKRTLTRPAAGKKNRPVTQKIEYFRLYPNGTTTELKDNDNLNEGSNVKTTQAIKEAIGGERDFDLVISANADNLKELISLKETDRGRLLTRWVGLLPLEDKDNLARDKWNHEISVNRQMDKYNTEGLKAEIADIEEQIREAEEQIKKDEKIIEDSTNKIAEYTTTQHTLIESKKEIKQDLLKVDVATLENTMKALAENGKIRSGVRDKYKEQYDSIGDVEFSEVDYKEKSGKEKELLVSIANIKSQIEALKQANKNLKESEYCPMCKRKFDDIDNTETIKENKAKIDELIKTGIELNTQKENIVQEIKDLDENRALYNEKNRLDLLITKLDVELSTKRAEYKEKKQLLKEINDNKSAIEENNRIETSINIMAQNIKNEEVIKSAANSRIVNAKRDIQEYNNKIIDRKVIINKIAEEVEIDKNWKLYLMLVGKDGISKMVLRNALPIINCELRRFLDGVCNFNVEVEINDRNEVDFVQIFNDGVRQRLAAGSGFEQTAAALALRVVLGNMSSLSKPPFLLLDEVLGGVAKCNYPNLKKLYDKIVQNFAFVFQITHIEDIIDWHDRVITVVKKDYVSKIELKQ